MNGSHFHHSVIADTLGICDIGLMQNIVAALMGMAHAVCTYHKLACVAQGFDGNVRRNATTALCNGQCMHDTWKSFRNAYLNHLCGWAHVAVCHGLRGEEELFALYRPFVNDE